MQQCLYVTWWWRARLPKGCTRMHQRVFQLVVKFMVSQRWSKQWSFLHLEEFVVTNEACNNISISCHVTFFFGVVSVSWYQCIESWTCELNTEHGWRYIPNFRDTLGNFEYIQRLNEFSWRKTSDPLLNLSVGGTPIDSQQSWSHYIDETVLKHCLRHWCGSQRGFKQTSCENCCKHVFQENETLGLQVMY